MDKATKVFLACALGAGLGATVALEVNGMLWWIGMLAGGLFGVLNYELISKRWLKLLPRETRA